jgi:crotonobetainyl-CoA:carnitine CoA-transferase CaiB-like acyl-CoA transferase
MLGTSTTGEVEAMGDPPLAGLKVVEISMYAQGPIAGMILAGLGADVVKIEPVGSQDPFRTFAGMFGVQLDEEGARQIFASVNRGKRCIALDVTSDAGRPVFHRLVEDADVFVSNLRRSALDKMGADADTLTGLNPRLVYARGAGFGFSGEIADDPCQDTVGMAYSGFMDMVSTTPEPNYPPGALSDVATGTNLASAIMAGLLKRGITGTGSVVGTSQVQTMMWLQTFGIGFAANQGTRMARFDRAKAASPLLSIYETSDGWISIGAVTNDQWLHVAHTMGLEGMLADPRFASLDDLIANSDAAAPFLIGRFGEEPTEHWWRLFREAGIWVSPVNRYDQLHTDPHILANNYIVTHEDGSSGSPSPSTSMPSPVSAAPPRNTGRTPTRSSVSWVTTRSSSSSSGWRAPSGDESGPGTKRPSPSRHIPVSRPASMATDSWSPSTRPSDITATRSTRPEHPSTKSAASSSMVPSIRCPPSASTSRVPSGSRSRTRSAATAPVVTTRIARRSGPTSESVTHRSEPDATSSSIAWNAASTPQRLILQGGSSASNTSHSCRPSSLRYSTANRLAVRIPPG